MPATSPGPDSKSRDVQPGTCDFGFKLMIKLISSSRVVPMRNDGLRCEYGLREEADLRLAYAHDVPHINACAFIRKEDESAGGRGTVREEPRA